MKPNHVPAAGEAMPKTDADPLVAAINAYRAALDDFRKNAPDDDKGADAFAEETYVKAEKVLENWSEPATSMAAAIEALRVSQANANGCQGTPAADRMIEVAMGYFATVDNEDPWLKSRRLMKELSVALQECSDGLYAAHMMPIGGDRFERFLKRLPSDDDPETAVDRVDRLASELSDALSQWAGGTYQAMVQPSNLAGHSVFFVKAGPWGTRMAV